MKMFLSCRCPTEMCLSDNASIVVTEIAEGSESKEFHTAIENGGESVYDSLINGDDIIVIGMIKNIRFFNRRNIRKYSWRFISMETQSLLNFYCFY